MSHTVRHADYTSLRAVSGALSEQDRFFVPAGIHRACARGESTSAAESRAVGARIDARRGSMEVNELIDDL